MSRIGKMELTSIVSEKTGFAKKDVSDIIDATFAAIEDAMSKKDDVVIFGFGKWSVQDVKERVGRNLSTNEPMIIPAKCRTKFTVGSKLKEAAVFYVGIGGTNDVDVTIPGSTYTASGDNISGYIVTCEE